MKPVSFFTRSVHSFWATCYELDLKLFDQFLLRRLGNAPLNAVVLCDEDSVSATLGGLSDIDLHVASNANRRYLLRGVRPASGGRFHPKTYFFASARGAYLLVGSGNLTHTGLDRGRETFVEFDTAKPDDLAVIRCWTGWLRSLVATQDDPVLRRRFEHLVSSLPLLVGPADDGQFATNDTRPVLDQILEQAPSRVAELHVCAPFYDPHAKALADLIARSHPERALHIYLGARTNVDGGALNAVLAAADCPVHVHGFEPSEFIHAKLVGLVGSDGTGLLVCGSANISQAALTRDQSVLGSAANIEVVVFRRGSAADIKAAFLPPDHQLVDLSLDSLTELEYVDDEPPLPRWAVRLRRATVLENRHIRVQADSGLDHLSLLWEGTISGLALTPEGQTEEPLPSESDPLIVWLVDPHGAPCSNPVVMDDPQALDAALGEAEGVGERPAELHDDDSGSELLRLLTWAHRRFIFDVDDTAALQRATNAQEHQTDVDDTGFWERYAKEELTSDPRSQTYRPIGTTAALTEADLLLREIEAMLKIAPPNRRLRLIRPPGPGDGGPENDPAARHPWSFSARERVRARNLLRRWARALADPRHAWISSAAPARNYEALLEVLTLIWLGGALDATVLAELLGEVWTALLGGNGQRGLLDRADPELADELVGAVAPAGRELAAGLAYCALYGALPWTEWIYEWQPFLVRGIELGLFTGGPFACDLVEAVWSTHPSEAELEDLLVRRSEWTDDETWARRMAKHLATGSIQFVPRAGFKGVSTVVRIDGLTDAGRDPRLVVLARRVMAFKKSDHVLIEAGDQRYLLRLGAVCRARIGDEMRTSVTPIDNERLAAIERQHGALAELLGFGSAA